MAIYCERIAPGNWQEPFNTSSAVAFIIAGVLGLSLCAKLAGDALRIVMSLCALFIGIASFLFHMRGIPPPLAYDLIPVVLFDICAAWAVIARGCKTQPATSLMLTAMIVITSVTLSPVSRNYGFFFNGIEHLGFVLWLSLFAILLLGKGLVNNGATLLLATATLLVALWFRSVDISHCAVHTHGTHWLWHVANAIGLYLIIRGIPIIEGKSRDVEVRTQL